MREGDRVRWNGRKRHTERGRDRGDGESRR